ncbi:uncharacterized protein AB675_5716 [Cyphellophora attinorum]|uniref:Uncharacterized protein n=1 Tax=Cyphellophora attinorum TaxID=1664694 RepID=A0A0N1HN56_9EURO|nr:uncharacterized protein AB675_5716 [Phialophora attinorum]KPI38843.1 hypothetical protein AB675_5716 [Phialophora attinorum]
MAGIFELLLILAVHTCFGYSQTATYNNGQWQPVYTTAWYQPTSYTTYPITHPNNGEIVYITSTVPCPPVSTIIVYTTDCPQNCCYDNNCCRNQFGGTCWDTNIGVTTQTLYTTITPGQPAQNNVITTTSAGVVYVIAANNQAAVVQGAAGDSMLAGTENVVMALVGGIAVVGIIMVLL